MTVRMIDKERMRIRAARHVPGEEFHKGVEDVLANLPVRAVATKQQTEGQKAALIACAVMLFCGLALPPAVRAAAPMIERLFNDIGQRLDQRLGMTVDERFHELLAMNENWSQEHEITEKAICDGVEIRIKQALFSSFGDPDAPDPNAGQIQLELAYDNVPAYDPNLMEYTISYDGKTIPVRENFNLPYYKEKIGRAKTAADWHKPEFIMGISQLYDGVATTMLMFDINPWRIEKPTEFVLRGVDGSVEFELPFMFDPEKAHEYAVDRARDSISFQIEYDRAFKERLEKLDAVACQLGVVKQFKDREYSLAQFAVMSDQPKEELVFGWSMHRKEGDQPEFDQGWLGDVYIDGMMMPTERTGELDNGAGECRMINTAPLGRDPARLPIESLFEVHLAMDTNFDVENTDVVAFRYHWKDNRATLPKDAAEEMRWIVESQRMHEALVAKTPDRMRYDISEMGLTQTMGGMTLTPLAVEVQESNVSFEYTFDRGEVTEGQYRPRMYYGTTLPELTMDERPPVSDNGTNHSNGVYSISFVSMEYMTEIGPGTRFQITLPVELIDDMGRLQHTSTFRFDFALADAPVEAIDADI